MAASKIAALGTLLKEFQGVAVAVSGGVDSLTLATVAGRTHDRVEMFHAVSPAVPPEATRRVQVFAVRENWHLQLVDAAEFSRQDYVSNPVNRCFFCKQSLYGAIETIAGATSIQIVSGTNADDLQEYRPGLEAARDFGVRHPFVELNVAKSEIRAMARALGLGDVAELPASPCLSSRVETGIVISPAMLRKVHAAESAVRACLVAESVRCRIRHGGLVVEIDAPCAATLTPMKRAEVTEMVTEIFWDGETSPAISIESYRKGSAFLVQTHD